MCLICVSIRLVPRSTSALAADAAAAAGGMDVTRLELGWAGCDGCGQWSAVERGHPMPDARQPWHCTDPRGPVRTPPLAYPVPRIFFANPSIVIF